MLSHLTRRQILASAAATAAVAAMPAAAAIAAVEQAPFDTDRFIGICVAETERLHPGINPPLAGWGFVVNDITRPLLARMPFDPMSDDGLQDVWHLLDQSHRAAVAHDPQRWIGVTLLNDEMRVVGEETWSYRQALIDAGHQLEALS